MSKHKQKFSDFITKHYDIRVKPMSATCTPKLWRKFKVGAVSIKGERIYIDGLSDIGEDDLCQYLAHETGHTEQQRKAPSWAYFVTAYYASQKYRAKREARAMKREMEMCHLLGRDIEGMPKYFYKKLKDAYLISDKRAEKARRALFFYSEQLKLGYEGTITKLYKEWQKQNG
jgi:hypothetical protein